MGIKYLWDTNTVIYYLQQQFPPQAEKFIDGILIDSNPAMSVITEIELLCWKAATDKDLEVLRDFINNALVFGLENDIKLKTVDIRKAYGIKLPDAIIAATALNYGLTLITRNTKDFKGVERLKRVNPFDR